MSESLAVKYRPQEWDSVCGQSSIIKILKRQLELNQLRNAYLFAGASGCGKTTLARIFANKINNNIGYPEEIDAASNNGVDNVKAIIKSAQERAIDSKYKIFIIDECFIGETLIKTSRGDIPIKDVKVGDSVASLTGWNKVIKTHKKYVPASRILKLRLNDGKELVCTEDHFIMTTSGWIEAKKLTKGDELIASDTMLKLWDNDIDEEKRSEILFKQMPDDLSKETETVQETNSEEMYNLRHKFYSELEIEECEDMFKNLQSSINISIREVDNELRIRANAKEIIITKNEDRKSNVESGKCCENGSHKESKRNITSTLQESRREWKIYTSADKAISAIRGFMGAGVTNKNKSTKKEQQQISFSVQSRPWFEEQEIGGRGGWQFPSIEKKYIAGYKENNLSGSVRVESVEIYQPGSGSTINKGDGNYIEVFDLSIENSPTYYANNVLVHNCHMISTQGWNAFLKCIEEPPAFTIFIFCTTDPQKIPDTILNRVQRYNITRINTDKIKERLSYICEQEGYINFSESVDYIAKISSGGMRDAISTLEKCASYSTDLNINNVLSALGNFSYHTMFDLVNALIDGNEPSVLNIIDDFYNSGNDLKLFVDMFLSFCLDISKYVIFQSCDILKIPTSMEEFLKNSTNFENAGQYYMYLVNQLLELKNMLKNDTNVKTTIEIMLLKIARMQ